MKEYAIKFGFRPNNFHFSKTIQTEEYQVTACGMMEAILTAQSLLRVEYKNIDIRTVAAHVTSEEA